MDAPLMYFNKNPLRAVSLFGPRISVSLSSNSVVFTVLILFRFSGLKSLLLCLRGFLRLGVFRDLVRTVFLDSTFDSNLWITQTACPPCGVSTL
ncbi:hypothetical protein GE061_007489 [Apolygus lucorum]|uniref:Uncharacterized protein n=1 Tax=Apolygus lucorum TaxID=248454 RepID=A0A8S9WS31_APOLU|nr:hypothetical protein GE061_007489 [Apolygus lucorum]